MPHRKTRRRFEIPGHARFLTFSCFQRLPLLDDGDAKDGFADQLFCTRARLGFALHAWVVMPEHVHLLLRPNLPEVDVPRILMAIKRPFATRVLRSWREVGREAPDRIWQAGGGYDRNIFSDREMREKVEYIHANPVRRGLVERAEDWAWSSARGWAGPETRWPAVDRW